MAETISLRVFWIAMLLTAATALVNIWAGPVIPQKLIPTFFIIGSASFFIWAPIMAYRFLHTR